ncbi:UNVERIFIED_CONTAM: hypothetical protein HDU68_005771 [Siphonaria sp. JEL0065]|nr:hypothetical protein HDU68_005771 [Siphonaria sp. JEL0065]
MDDHSNVNKEMKAHPPTNSKSNPPKKVRKLSDKRAEQVRLAQARFRANKKTKIRELELKLQLLSEAHNVDPSSLPIPSGPSTNAQPRMAAYSVSPVRSGSSSSTTTGTTANTTVKLLRKCKEPSYAVADEDEDGSDEYIPTREEVAYEEEEEEGMLGNPSNIDPGMLEKLKRDPRGNAELLKQLPPAMRRQLQVRFAQRSFWMRKQQKIKDLEAQVAVLEALDQRNFKLDEGASRDQVPTAAEPPLSRENTILRVERPEYDTYGPLTEQFGGGVTRRNQHHQAREQQSPANQQQPLYLQHQQQHCDLQYTYSPTVTSVPIRLPPIHQMLQLQHMEAPFFNSPHPPPPLSGHSALLPPPLPSLPSHSVNPNYPPNSRSSDYYNPQYRH